LVWHDVFHGSMTSVSPWVQAGAISQQRSVTDRSRLFSICS
jgi:hypothetical protein